MKDTFWSEEYSGKPILPLKRKRSVGKRKLEFIGWGSRPLLAFLEVIGEDTVKKHSQREVSEFVTRYVHDKSLVKKKKRVECDEILRALFGKPSVSRKKIYDLLEGHFAENLDDSDDDLLHSSEEENYKEKSSKSNSIGHKKKVFESPKSCFAAIIPENIKLVYLKRTLIQEFLKVPESFECKMVGSFVRMKSDLNDIYQKNRFQLQQVTGVKKLSGASDAGIETFLQVSNHFKDVRICILSDDNFSEKFKSSSPFGIKYKFHLEDAVDCPEWIVPSHVFKSLAEEELVFCLWINLSNHMLCVMMAGMFCGVNMGETETATPVEPSSKSARKRRMEIHQFNFVPNDSAVVPPLLKKWQMIEVVVQEKVNGNELAGVQDERETKLSTPSENSPSDSGTELGLLLEFPKFGTTSVCGRRRDMEDSVAIHPFFCITK